MASDARARGSAIRACLIASDPVVSAAMELTVEAAVRSAAIAAQNSACDADVEASLKRLPAHLGSAPSGSRAALRHWAARDQAHNESRATADCSTRALYARPPARDASSRATAHLLLSRPNLFRRPSSAAHPEHLRREKNLVSSRLTPGAGSRRGMAASTAARGSVAARSLDLAAALAHRPYGRLCDYLHCEALGSSASAATHASSPSERRHTDDWRKAYTAAACTVASVSSARSRSDADGSLLDESAASIVRPAAADDMPMSAARAAARSFLHDVTAEALGKAPAAARMIAMSLA